jgi:hypothetical protein
MKYRKPKVRTKTQNHLQFSSHWLAISSLQMSVKTSKLRVAQPLQESPSNEL